MVVQLAYSHLHTALLSCVSPIFYHLTVDIILKNVHNKYYFGFSFKGKAFYQPFVA